MSKLFVIVIIFLYTLPVVENKSGLTTLVFKETLISSDVLKTEPVITDSTLKDNLMSYITKTDSMKIDILSKEYLLKLQQEIILNNLDNLDNLNKTNETQSTNR